MTDTTTTATGTVSRRSWLTHPVLTWRAYQAALAQRVDAEAVAAGLTVQVLPNGLRRYHDPRLDSLAEHRARHATTDLAATDDVEAAAGSADRLRRTQLLAGAGAVPPPPVPHQGRCAGSASLRDHLTVALDPGHPAAAVSGAPAGRHEEHAPARLLSGPANPPGGAR